MKKGFTLIELLITLSLITIILSVVLPVSYSTYKSYQESLEAEKVLMFLSSLKRDSFLYSRGKVIETIEGRLEIDGEEKDFKDIYVHTEGPIIFYKNGTTSGGEIRLEMANSTFLIYIEAPSGNLKFTRE